MAPRIAVDFACNDPDNGLFAGHVLEAQLGEAELEAPTLNGFRFTVGDGWIRIHRRQFEIVGSHDWVGNWCWNRYWFKPTEAHRLFSTMRSNGWRCTTGPCQVCEWFRSEGRG